MLTLATALLFASAPADTGVLARIREEGLQRSKVMETALGLSDLNGPRLAGSVGYLRAAEWAKSRLAGFGLSGAALEPWGEHAPTWELDGFSLEMTAPHYLRLTAFPKAWSAATKGVVKGAPVLIQLRNDADAARYKGKLRGKVVLNGTLLPLRGREAQSFSRVSDRQLDSLARLAAPIGPTSYDDDAEGYASGIERRRRLRQFLKAEGAIALLEPSRNEAALGASGEDDYSTPFGGGVAEFTVARQHWNRLVRMVEAGQTIRLEASLRARLVQHPTTGYNVVAELKGSDPTLAPEVVMIGGHLDSWAAATGATDNAAGCAIVMEALRILRAIDARPRRTIRVALWDGEESGDDYMGSMGYVRKHFGEWKTMQLLPEHARLSAYYNVDNGGGKLRGIFLQGNAAARGVFEGFFAPLADLGARTVSIAGTGSTDHMSFVAVGLPAFQFITDGLDYGTRSHHTDLDNADYLIEDDLKQAAVVVATIAYQTAMADAQVPRPPLPAARVK
ncbi:MAG: M20/M25/M40 family metallo-hydrolase [Gemmatimonadales bacterium]|nr:M20/M25/M40 family metallo-hydrolase [Gemmatimonadales bacterium]